MATGESATLPDTGIERWAPAKAWAKGVLYDYTGLYEVSQAGIIRSLDRLTGGPQGPLSRIFPGRVLKPYVSENTRGYPVVGLSKDGERKNWPVHIIVLTSWAGPPEEGQEARHGPNGKLDARLSELCWGTRAENVGVDRLRDGQDNRGERHGGAVLTREIVLDIRAKVSAGWRQTDIARRHRISTALVWAVVHRKCWDWL